MKRLLVFPLMLATTVAAAPMPKVEVASGDWSMLPALQFRGYDHLDSNVMQAVWDIAKSKTCAIPGYALGPSVSTLNFHMSFATQYNPDGSVARIVFPKLDCPKAEGIIGGALVEMIQGGDYRRAGESEQGWYQGSLTFQFEGGRS